VTQSSGPDNSHPAKGSTFDVIIPLLVVVVGTFALFHPMIGSGFALIQTDQGDTRMVNYYLEHGYRWFRGDSLHRDVWDLPVFFPAPHTGSYSELLLGAGPYYWIFRLLRIAPDTAFQWWMLCMGVLNFISFYVALRSGAGLGAIASAGGAYLFAFAGMRATQLNHQQLLPQFYSALAVLSLFRIFASQTPNGRVHPTHSSLWTLVLAVSVVLQFYACYYLGFLFGLGLVIAACVSLGMPEARSAIPAYLRSNRAAVVAAILVCVPSLGWLAYHYVLGQAEVGSRPWGEVAEMVPRWKSWINMGPTSAVYAWLAPYLDVSTLPNEPNHRIGLGIATLVMAILGARELYRIVWGRVVLYSCLAALAVSFMYPFGWSPWKLVYSYVPGAGAIRVPTRIGLVVLIPVSIAVAMFLNNLRRPAVAILLLLFVCVEQVHTTPAYDKFAVRERIDTIVTKIPKDCPAFYCAFGETTAPDDDRYWVERHVDAMWAQMATGIPTANGFSGSVPPGWAPLLEEKPLATESDLMRVHLNVMRWADSFGLASGVIRVIPILEKPLLKASVDLKNYEIVFGTDAAEPFLGTGWGDNEQDKGVTWAWAVGNHASLFIPLRAGSAYRMEITGVPMKLRDRQQILSVHLNGTAIGSLTMADKPERYEVALPASLVREYNTVRLFFRHTASPAEIGEGRDTRPLAAAVLRVRFTAEEGS
jgi:hypothetical protein